MAHYYCFPTQAEAQACIDFINSTPWFPIVGKCEGVDATGKQSTQKWCDAPIEKQAGGWAVPRIPQARVDYVGVPEADQIAFITAYGQDIQDLSSSDLILPDPEE